MSNGSNTWPKQEGSPFLLFSLFRLATFSAFVGGAVILVVASIVTASVVMRNIGLGGVQGDFELVQMSCAVAAGFFLPLCQYKKGHVMVDLFTDWLPKNIVDSIDRFWTFLFALGWFCLFYYTIQGMEEIKEYGDKSMLLKLPMWWAFIPAVIGTGISGLIAFAQVFFWRDDAVSIGHS